MIRLFVAALATSLPLMANAQVAPSPAPAAPAAPAPAPAFADSNLSPAGVRAIAANCAACHGTNGKPAPGSTLAGLAGKPKDELLTALKQFKEGKKPATLMHQISKGYTDAELDALATYFAAQPR